MKYKEKKKKTQQNEVGGVNTEAMYDHLMNKFVFNITKPGFLVSDDIYRMTVTMRNTYARLAEALVEENKMDKAIEVCDRIQQLIPDRIVPYNYFNIGIAESYLKAGEVAKGTEIIERIIDIQDEQLAYFFSFPQAKQGYLTSDIQQGPGFLDNVRQSRVSRS